MARRRGHRVWTLARRATLLALLLVAPVSPAHAATPASKVEAYSGLGTWVDIYDGRLWQQPGASVDAMKARGVSTLFLQTSNYQQGADLVRPRQLAAFIAAAHARGIRVVAWYLPSFRSLGLDYRRSLAAIRFRTASGDRFDSFALDIEASLVRPAAVRSRRLLRLSQRIRASAPLSYPIGAIIPSPRGMQLHPTFWPGFPYGGLARYFDVFLPMSYFTYHTSGFAGVRAETALNIDLIRKNTGNPAVPVHVIGGIAGSAHAGDIRGFVAAVRERGVLGASLYDFASTGANEWRELAPLLPPVGP